MTIKRFFHSNRGDSDWSVVNCPLNDCKVGSFECIDCEHNDGAVANVDFGKIKVSGVVFCKAHLMSDGTYQVVDPDR